MNNDITIPINTPQSLNTVITKENSMLSINTNEIGKSMDYRINNLVIHNNHLQEENIKYHTKIIQLEAQLKEKCNQNYHSQHSNNNTSYSFYLPSEIQVMWQSLALGLIGDCFMELFHYPHIIYHLLQEMFFILIQMVKEKIRRIINTFLSQCNIGQDDEEYQMAYDGLFSIIRPFMQQNVRKVFEEDRKFNEGFMGNYMRFYNSEIRLMIENEDELIGEGFNEEIEGIIQSKSFEIMMETMKKIVIFIELNDQKLQFDIEDYSSREMKMMERKSSLNEKEVLNVLGKSAFDWEMMTVLIQPPMMKNGFAYRNLMPIVLTSENISISKLPSKKHINSITTNGGIILRTNSNSNDNDNDNKPTTTSPRMSIRSISFNNIYNYNCTSVDREDIEGDADNDIETEAVKVFQERMTMNSPNNAYPIETDYNRLDKLKTQRYTCNNSQTISTIFNKGNSSTLLNTNTINANASKVSNGSNCNNTNGCFNNTFIGKGVHSHTRSLPKSTIEQEIYYDHCNNTKKQINLSKKNPKVYKIKRQGKSIQFHEIKDCDAITKRWWDSPSLIHTRQKYICMKVKNSNNKLKKGYIDEGKGINDFSASNSIIDTCGNITNHNHHKKKYIQNSRGNSKGSVDLCYVQTTTTNGQSKRNNSKSKGINSTATAGIANKKKTINQSIEKQSRYDYKTNAATRLNVEELLSFKHKAKGKIIKEFTNTFTNHHHYHHNGNVDNMKLKP